MTLSLFYESYLYKIPYCQSHYMAKLYMQIHTPVHNAYILNDNDQPLHCIVFI